MLHFLAIISFIAVTSTTFGFCQTKHCRGYHRPTTKTTLYSVIDDEVIAKLDIRQSTINRRNWLHQSSSLVSSILFVPRAHANGIAENNKIVPKNKSVIVLGANGGTGRECVSAILASGRTCYATTRSGSFNYDEGNSSSLLIRNNPKLFEDKADVTSLDGLLTLVDRVNEQTPVGAMIFAASASAKGNDAGEVDYQGVINAAQCCIQKGIPRLVVVSSGAVTRPNSAVYKLLNFVGNGIMQAKIRGEDEVRELYKNKAVVDQGLGYTIVRPGGLTNDAPLGPAALEVNQGDDKSGRLSRADVAGICVASLDVESSWDTTFECYLKDTAKPVDNVGLSNILRSTDSTSYKSGREGTGDTWDELLGNLKLDFE